MKISSIPCYGPIKYTLLDWWNKIIVGQTEIDLGDGLLPDGTLKQGQHDLRKTAIYIFAFGLSKISG